MPPRTQQLLKAIAHRQTWASWAGWAYRLCFVFAGVYAALLLASRFLGLLPGEWVSPWVLPAVPVLACLIAVFCARRACEVEAARLADQAGATKDLFLTAALLSRTPGNFQPVVAEAAEARASQLHARKVVPWNMGWNRVSHLFLAMLLLSAAAFFLPEWDPFGYDKNRDDLVQKIDELKKQEQAARWRIQELQAAQPKAELTQESQDAVNRLLKTLEELRQNHPKENLARLNQNQKELGERWRQASEQKLQSQSASQLSQRFGQGQNDETRSWKKELESGKTKAMEQELKELSQMVREMQSAKGEEAEKIKSQMAQRLQQMSDFADTQMGSPGMQGALKQAMQQLQNSQLDGLSEQSLESLQTSLELTEQELQQVAQSVRDLQELEKAMRAIQMAKALNQGQQGSGENASQEAGSGPQGAQTLDEYVQLLQQMQQQAQAQQQAQQGGACQHCQGTGRDSMSGGTCPQCEGSGMRQGAGQGQGQGQGGPGAGQTAQGGQPGSGGSGQGMGGPGQGRGGAAPEDPDSVTSFTPEKSSSSIGAGKILLKWKTKELGAVGEAKIDYAQTLQTVKQGASEAILQEQVPPGYHDAIKKYFDTLDQAAPRPSAPAPAP